MKITIDGQAFPLAPEIDAETALEEVQQHLNRQERVIQAVAINGRPEQDWAPALGAMQPEELQSLDIQTTPARDLLRETVTDMAAELPPLADLVEQIAMDLQRGEDWAGFGKLPSATDRLQSYAQLLPILGEFWPGLRPDSERRVTALDHWLRKITAAWQEEDTVLLADYLRYELAPQIRDGDQWLRSLEI